MFWNSYWACSTKNFFIFWKKQHSHCAIFHWTVNLYFCNTKFGKLVFKHDFIFKIYSFFFCSYFLNFFLSIHKIRFFTNVVEASHICYDLGTSNWTIELFSSKLLFVSICNHLTFFSITLESLVKFNHG